MNNSINLFIYLYLNTKYTKYTKYTCYIRYICYITNLNMKANHCDIFGWMIFKLLKYSPLIAYNRL